MTLPQYHADNDGLALSWEALGQGAPTIIALAQLCGQAITRDARRDSGLSTESRALLFAAKNRGVFAVKGSNKAFDSVDRFLSIHVELDEETVLAFKSKREPSLTVRYLDAFRQLCGAGLVYHQLFCEFSLSTFGFETAAGIERIEVESHLAQGVELGRHEW